MATQNVGLKIRNRRKELNLSQQELATRTGMGRSHLTRIEGGIIDPTWGTVERLAKALKTTPVALLAA